MLELARRSGVDVPIVEQVHAVLFEGVRAPDVVHQLMLREPKAELAGLEAADGDSG